MKFGPVTSELTVLICECQVRHGQKTGAFSQISPDILDLFLQSFHLMKALYVQVMDLYQGTLLWQPNNVAKMLSLPTDITCIHCTSARKRIAVSLTTEMMWLHHLKIW